MTYSRAAILALAVLWAVATAWAGTEADDFIGIYNKLGYFTALSAAGKKPCLCMRADQDGKAVSRMLLYRDELTRAVDCGSRNDSLDAKSCRSNGGSVLSIDQARDAQQ